MGWCRGSEIANNVWAKVREYIPVGRRRKIAREIIELFEDMDCDTIDEAETLCADAGRTYDEENDQIVYTPSRPPGVPSREEMYRILKARSDELKSALTDLDPCRDCQRSTASCHVCEHGGP